MNTIVTSDILSAKLANHEIETQRESKREENSMRADVSKKKLNEEKQQLKRDEEYNQIEKETQVN